MKFRAMVTTKYTRPYYSLEEACASIESIVSLLRISATSIMRHSIFGHPLLDGGEIYYVSVTRSLHDEDTSYNECVTEIEKAISNKVLGDFHIEYKGV